MKLIHPSFFSKEKFTDVEIKYWRTSEFAIWFPYVVLTFGFIDSEYRKCMRNEFKGNLRDALASTVAMIGLLGGLFISFPISVPGLIALHYVLSKRSNKRRMIDALKGNF